MSSQESPKVSLTLASVSKKLFFLASNKGSSVRVPAVTRRMTSRLTTDLAPRF